MIEIPLQRIINEAVKEKRENKEISSWHISKIGSCPRGVYLERQGLKPDEDFSDRQLRVFSVGKHFEEWFVGLLQGREGVKAETQVRVEDKRLGVSGYADLLLETQEGKKVYEIKTQHSKSFWYYDNQKKPQDHHRYQLWMYLYLLGVEEGSIVYL